jgi:hypothetical protein
MVEIDRGERMRPGSSHSQRAAVKASSQRDYPDGGSEHGDREVDQGEQLHFRAKKPPFDLS